MLTRERAPVQGHRPCGCRPTSRTIASASPRSRATRSSAPSGKLVESLLPVLDACEAAFAHGVDGVEPIWSQLMGVLQKQGLEALDLADKPFDPSRRRRRPPRRRRWARAGRQRCAAHRLPLEGQDPARSDGESQGLTMAAQRDWYEKDFYKVLGVSETATPKEITKAYRKLARRTTPTPNPGDTAAENRFKDVSAAYDVIGDEAKRKEYDEVRRLGPIGFGFGGFGGGRRSARPGGLQLQRRRRRARRPARRHVQPRRPRPRRVRGRRAAARRRPRGDPDARLRRCRPGPHHHALPHQRRAVQHLQRLRRQAGHHPEDCSQSAAAAASSTTTRASSRSARPCRNCQGRGVIIEQACPTCRGTRCREAGPRGQGAHPGRRRRRSADPAEGPRRPRPQRRPRRRPARRVPRDAAPAVRPRRRQPHVRCPITFAEAALGGDIDVPTLDGPRVKLRAQARHAVRHPSPREGQGHRDRQAHRRPHRHRRRPGADVAERRAARRRSRRSAAATTRVAESAPGGMSDAAADPTPST